MWPRVSELVIAGWLAASPFVFGHYPDDRSLWQSDFLCAAAIAVCAMASFRSEWRRLHLAELPVAAWLLGFGYFARSEALPALQNDLLVGMVLLMFAVIPSDANRPPLSWRQAESAP